MILPQNQQNYIIVVTLSILSVEGIIYQRHSETGIETLLETSPLTL